MKPTLINKLSLCYLADLNGIPQEVGEVADYIEKRLRHPARAETRAALERLETLGYVARAEATAAAEPLYKITASGLRQASRQVRPEELDPMVWG